MLVDQDSGIMKALGEADVDIKNLDLKVHKEKGMRFKTCPVSGHNYHGLGEVKIRTVQECLDKCDLSKLRLHATGLQTLCKLIENDMNNLPMGFSYGRDADNSHVLKMLCPNMLRKKERYQAWWLSIQIQSCWCWWRNCSKKSWSPAHRFCETSQNQIHKSCSSCCCLSHCEKNPHRDEHDVQVVLSSLDLPDE